jgi:AraC family transcriptional regulator
MKIYGDHADPYFTRRELLNEYSKLSVTGSALSAAYFRREDIGLGETSPNPIEDIFQATVNLSPLIEDDLWRDGRASRRAAMPRGGLAVLDLRHKWTTRIVEPFEVIQLFLPVSAFEEFADQMRVPRIDTLNCPMTTGRQDDVMLHLASSLIPAFMRQNEVPRLFADHLFEAIRFHMAVTYGFLPAGEPVSGRLSSWQLKRAEELLLDDLAANRSLAELAAACDVSIRHFSRAFKTSTGVPPHRWLLKRRIERAKLMLLNSQTGISEIAQDCGFSDQSHLTRVFHAATDSTPASWRHQQRQ